MKNIKWMLTALLAVALATPVFAQSQAQQEKVAKAIERAALQAAQQAQQADAGKCIWCGRIVTDDNYGKCPADPDVCCNPANPNAEATAKAHTCYRCGKSFRAGQHCSETGYTSLCANSPEQERALQQAEEERMQKAAENAVCPKCGKVYTTDERYHHVNHICQQ